MDPQDIVDERGVIAGEERLRNTPELRSLQQQLAVIAKGQKAANRFPIGDLKIINSAPRDRFVEYYTAYYRPERATLIAVGDFNVDAMEKRVKTRFYDWRPKAPNGPDPDLGTLAPHGPEAHVITQSGISPSVSILRLAPPDLTPDTIAKRRADTVRTLGFAILNRRLLDISREDHPPILGAQASQVDFVRSVKFTGTTAQFIQGHWQQALDTIEQEQRRIVEFGVTQPELDRAIDVMRVNLRNGVASAKTRNTRLLAAQLDNAVNAREVFTSPETDQEIFESTVKGLSVADVNMAMKQAFEGEVPITLVQTPKPIEGGDAAVAAAFAKSTAVQVAAYAPPAKKQWPYTTFGTPSAIVERGELPGLGIKTVKFANGVELWVKSTEFNKDSIGVSVSFGNGMLAFAPDRLDPASTAIGAFSQGGLGKLGQNDVSRTLAGHDIGIGFTTGDDHFYLSGGTNKQDLPLQMQVLAAYLTDAAFDSAPFDKAMAQYPQSLAMLRSLPAGAFQFDARELLAGGDKRVAVRARQHAHDVGEGRIVRLLTKQRIRRGRRERGDVGLHRRFDGSPELLDHLAGDRRVRVVGIAA